MSTEVKVPAFPESVTDGTVVAWHKQAGDSVRRGDNLVDIETDKVVFEVPAPVDGVLQEVLIEPGAVVVSGQVLARLGDVQASGAAAKVDKPAPAAAAAPVSEVGAMPAARRAEEA